MLAHQLAHIVPIGQSNNRVLPAMLHSKRRPGSRNNRIDEEEDDEFTAEDMEVADIMVCLRHWSRALIVQWGAKRRRSGIFRDKNSETHNAHSFKHSPVSPLGLSWSEEAEEFECCGDHLNSKGERVRKAARRRAPKKKTHRELKEMVNALTLEGERLKKRMQDLLKTYRELQNRNEHLKSQLACCLDHGQEQKQLSTPQHASSEQDSGHRTETSFNDSPTPNEHDSFENYVSTLALGIRCPEPQSVGRPTGSYSPGCSSESEKVEFSRSTKDPLCFSGIPDLNTPSESLSDAVPNGFGEQMLLSISKAAVAAEARKRRIELTRVKHAQSRKARSR